MIRLLIVLVCLSALALAGLTAATHYTITIQVRRVDEPQRLEPATVPEPAKPALAPAARKVDSHHTKGA